MAIAIKRSALRFDPRVSRFIEVWELSLHDLYERIERIVAVALDGHGTANCALRDVFGSAQHWVDQESKLDVWLRAVAGADTLEVVGVDGPRPSRTVEIPEEKSARPLTAGIVTNGPRAWARVSVGWGKRWEVFVETRDSRPPRWLAHGAGSVCVHVRKGGLLLSEQDRHVRKLAGPPSGPDDPPLGFAAVPSSAKVEVTTVGALEQRRLSHPGLLEVADQQRRRLARPFDPAKLTLSLCAHLPKYRRPDW